MSWYWASLEIKLGTVERYANLISARTRRKSDHIGKPRNKSPSSYLELGFHPLKGKGIRAETLVGLRGGQADALL